MPHQVRDTTMHAECTGRGARPRAAALLRTGWPVLALLLYAALDLSWIVAGWDADPERMRAVASWGAVPAVLSVVLMTAWLLRARRMSELRRRAWTWLLAAFLMMLAGTTCWAIEVTARSAAVGDLSDVVFWCSFPLAAVAMALFFRDVGGSFREPIVWLDAGTLAIALGVAMWEFVVRPNLLPATGSPGSAAALAIYSAAFVATLVFACLVYMQVSDWRGERALALLIAAMLADVLPDCFSAGAAPHTLAAALLYQFGYLGACLLIVSAVITDSRREHAAARVPVRSATATSTLPALAVLLSVVALIIVHATPHGTDTRLTIGVALLGALLVAAREVRTRYDAYRSHRQRAMREAEERLTELIRRSRDVIAVVAPDGRLSYVSPAAHRVLGLSPEDLLGQPAAALVGRGDAARMAAYVDALIAGQPQSMELEFDIVLPSGAQHIVGVVGSDQRSSAVIGGIALTLRDATAERRAERAVRAGDARERKQLSSEAHEGIAQELTGISLLVQRLRGAVSVSDPRAAADLKTVLDELGRAIAGVRRVATALSPVRVARGSLSGAVRQLALDVSSSSGIAVETDARLADEEISESLREDAFRILQAALARAARDPRCTEVGIGLAIADRQLELSCSGDGGRLAPDPAGEDCELMHAIVHRVQRLRGSLTTEQPAGGGTRLVVRLPCGASPG